MTAEEILALPILGFGSRETIDDSGKRVSIPIAPALLVMPYDENEPVFVVDADGVAWTKVLTTDGMRRRPFY